MIIELIMVFGVCPVIKDPTVVKIKHRIGTPWHVEVSTLSSCIWILIPSSNILFESVRIDLKPRFKTQVVIDRFIYWGASDMTSAHAKYIILSFDLITKEFKVVDLPDSLRNELDGAHVSLAKLRESLVVYGSIYVDTAECCGVWVMDHDSSFSKLFTIGARVIKILGFSRSGETIFEIRKEGVRLATLDIYDPCSQQVKNLGISGWRAHSSWALTANRYFYLITQTWIYIYIMRIIDQIDNGHISRLGFTKWMLPQDGGA
ncbi:probable galacturonosyltransferase 7 isoform X2 [Tanacetum coccineum]